MLFIIDFKWTCINYTYFNRATSLVVILIFVKRSEQKCRNLIGLKFLEYENNGGDNVNKTTCDIYENDVCFEYFFKTKFSGYHHIIHKYRSVTKIHFSCS